MTTPGPTLRAATAADLDFAFEVTKAALGEYVVKTFGWDEAAQRALHARRFDPSRTRVIVEDDQDVGVVVVREEDDRLRMLQMFLLPHAQSRGIGAAVLERVLEDARTSGRTLALRVLCSNPRARAFYERHGMMVVNETETHWMMRAAFVGVQDGERFVEVEGARLWACVEGAGPVALLLHGGPGASDYLGPIGAMLRDHCTVVRYEQRGCGRSDDVGPRTVARNIADLEAVRAALGLERVTLVGHSWGAALGLAYALAHRDRVERFAYLAGVGVDLAWREGFEVARETRQDLDAGFLFPHNMALNRAVQADWERWTLAPGLPARLSGLDVPTLVVHGTGDLRPGDSAAALADRLPDARLEWIEGADHFLWLSHPEETRALLVPFVRGAAEPADGRR